MSEECVVAVYDTIDQAREAIEALTESGFPADRVSLAARTLKLEPEVREAIEFGDETEKDAAIGAGAGAILALLAQAGVVAVTGMGAFLVVGPVVAGGVVGGLIGAVAGWGVHADHIEEYEKKLHEGKTLVIAHGDPLSVTQAEDILRETNPISLHRHAESSADAPDIENT